MRTLLAFLMLASPAFANADDDAVAVAIAIANSQHVSTPIVEQPAHGFTWHAAAHKWVSADGLRWASPGTRDWQLIEQTMSRTVTIPAQGHWQRTCGRNGCTRRWVQTSPARTIRVEGTSLPAKQPSYPTRSVSGRRWTFNGGAITARHLAGGHHAHENFDRDWLNSLSQASLTALGSDAHEGRIREQFVVRD